MKYCRAFAIITLVIGWSVLACAPFAPEKRVSQREMLPEAYSNEASESDIVERWWETFDDDQLNMLVEEALAANYSLQQNWARLKQARALAVRSGAGRYPDLSMEGSASTGRRRTDDGRIATEGGVGSYTLGLVSTYELDLWGRIRSEKEAASLAAVASREEVNTVAMTLSANVTTRWIGILSQRMQKRLLERQLAANRTLVELVELRFRKSLASALDVFQQRQLVAQSRAQIPLVERTERQLLNELAVLLGRSSHAVPQIESRPLMMPTDVPATGIPAQLLTARPDIRAAWRRLEAADWDVAAARADRLPSVRLSANATYQTDELNLLFDNWLVNLAGNLTAPLLDGRRRKAEVDRRDAVAEENLAAYRQTILTAMREVEDALVGEAKLQDHLKGLNEQLSAAQNALNEARSRYRSGLSDYLPVLTQLLTVQNLERTIIQRKADLMVARVDLHRALGGAWMNELTPELQPAGVKPPDISAKTPKP